jgi:hypothetical protein
MYYPQSDTRRRPIVLRRDRCALAADAPVHGERAGLKIAAPLQEVVSISRYARYYSWGFRDIPLLLPATHPSAILSLGEYICSFAICN